MLRFHWMHRFEYESSQSGIVQMAKDFEESNINSVLLPYSALGPDFLMYVPKALEETKKITFMMALPAYGILPEYAAKIFKTMQNFPKSRLSINLVAGNFDQKAQEILLKYYPWDSSMVDSHEKRVALTEPWAEKFSMLMEGQNTEFYVVGSSDQTLSVANKYVDYLIISWHALNHEFLSKLTNVKPVLVIDPLIKTDKPVEYFVKNPMDAHPIFGTKDEVINQILSISTEFNINDFMISTDQKNIKPIMDVIKTITNAEKMSEKQDPNA